MKRRSLLLILIALMSVSLFAGGAAESVSSNDGAIDTVIDSPVRIEFWHSFSGTQLETIEGLCDEFNATVGAEKGITVVPVAQGSSTKLYSKVIGAIKAGNAPAVALANPKFVQDYITADYVVDLKPYIEDPEVGMEDYDDFFKAFREESESYSIPGIYSLPLAKNSDVLYYNADLFEELGLEPPTTWEELEEVSRVIYGITGKGAMGYDNIQYLFENLTLQYGGGYTDSEGNLLFADSPEAVEALEMYAGNVKEGIWRTAGEDYFFSGPFAKETIQMYIGGTVESSYINMKEPSFRWSATALPQKDPDNPKTLCYDHVICALRNNDNPESQYAAYEFIKFLTSTESSKAISMNTSYMAVRQSVLEDPEYASFLAEGGNDALKAAYSQIDSLYHQANFVCDTYTTSTVDNEVTSMMKKVLENGEDPKTAIDAAVKALR